MRKWPPLTLSGRGARSRRPNELLKHCSPVRKERLKRLGRLRDLPDARRAERTREQIPAGTCSPLPTSVVIVMVIMIVIVVVIMVMIVMMVVIMSVVVRGCRRCVMSVG